MVTASPYHSLHSLPNWSPLCDPEDSLTLSLLPPALCLHGDVAKAGFPMKVTTEAHMAKAGFPVKVATEAHTAIVPRLP